MTPDHDPRWMDAAAPYLLHAMPEEEARAFEDHLAGCAACRAEVEQLRVAADALPASPVQYAPPPELKGRIMAIVNAEAQLLRAAGSRADEPAGEPPPRRRRLAVLRPDWWSVRPALGVAGAVLVLALGALGGLIAGGAFDGSGSSRTVVAQTAPPGSEVRLIVRGSGHSTLTAQGLPAPGRGRVYQVWLLARGSKAPKPTNALFGVSTDGSASVDVPGSLKDVGAVLVTSEPEGGSRVPTRQPILSVTPA